MVLFFWYAKGPYISTVIKKQKAMTYEKMYDKLEDYQKQLVDNYPKDRKYWIKRCYDEQCVGTTDYQGMAYFWGQDYKHILRDVTDQERKAVHDAWLDAGLELTGSSKKHHELLEYHCEKSLSHWRKIDSLYPLAEKLSSKMLMDPEKIISLIIETDGEELIETYGVNWWINFIKNS